MWNGIVDGQIDVAFATTVSGSTRKLEPLHEVFLADRPSWGRTVLANMLAVVPYYTQHIATRGTAISETEPHEGATILIRY